MSMLMLLERENMWATFRVKRVYKQGNSCLHYCFTYNYGDLGDYLISKVWAVPVKFLDLKLDCGPACTKID